MWSGSEWLAWLAWDPTSRCGSRQSSSLPLAVASPFQWFHWSIFDIMLPTTLSLSLLKSLEMVCRNLSERPPSMIQFWRWCIDEFSWCGDQLRTIIYKIDPGSRLKHLNFRRPLAKLFYMKLQNNEGSEIFIISFDNQSSSKSVNRVFSGLADHWRYSNTSLFSLSSTITSSLHLPFLALSSWLLGMKRSS